MQWTDEQKEALRAVNKWFAEFHTSRNYKTRKQVFYLAGYAGVGKTSMAVHFAENVDGDVAFASFTGKAALVMQKNGCIGARTIHSLIYRADEDSKTGVVTWYLNKDSVLNDVKLLIVDEVSMVNEELAKDLLWFGKPILVLGDPGQLPPVSGTGYFTARKPDFMLTQIHRQAKDNPIIYLATQARNKIFPEVGDYGESRVVSRMISTDVLDADQALVGKNATRHMINSKMRKLLDRNPDCPEPTDKLICLANDRDLYIYNGGMFTVRDLLAQKYKTSFLHMALDSLDDETRPPVLVKVHKSLFLPDVPTPDWKFLKGSQSFDYGIAITGHKGQGSQWSHVFCDGREYTVFRDDRWNWLYTCITRASEKLVLVKD